MGYRRKKRADLWLKKQIRHSATSMDSTMETFLLDALEAEERIGAQWHTIATVPAETLGTAAERGYANLDCSMASGRRPRVNLTKIGREVAKGLRGERC